LDFSAVHCIVPKELNPEMYCPAAHDREAPVPETVPRVEAVKTGGLPQVIAPVVTFQPFMKPAEQVVLDPFPMMPPRVADEATGSE
jgi:hypothetical protein